LKENLAIGDRLRMVMELRGMGVSELASKADLSQPYISFIVHNKRQPTIKTLEKIAEVLRVPVSIFFDRVTEPTLDIYNHFPQEIQEFLAKERSIDYIAVAKEASDNGISPEDIRTIISVLQKNRKQNNKRNCKTGCQF